jgi:hypothetical protein
MKLKTIKTIALAALVVAGVSSCEDMLKVDSKTYMFDYQNELDNPTDTVYSVLGIINKLQKIADRNIILGEIRGDLVAISDHASEDLRELYSYDFTSLKATNKYDQPVDYYAVINNCNFFLANADTALVRNQRHVLKGEYIAVLAYRAWAYMQLAQIYGEVPFKAIGSDPAASGEKKNIKEIAKLLLAEIPNPEELISYYDRYAPNYGEIGGDELGDGTTSTKHKTKEMFIPIRLILGDLCLWAEDYAHAALYYHDFLAGDNRAYTTGLGCVTWLTNDFTYTGYDDYTYNTFGSSNYIAYLPMEADEYSGTISELSNIFESTYENDYWYQLTRSRALTATSVRQNYCYHAKVSAKNRYTWPAYIPDKKKESEVLLRGDLRLSAILETDYDYLTDDELSSSNYGTEIQTLNKINSEKIWLYRKDVVYLRLAEALNRCGLPQTAFLILKEGLCKETIDSLGQGEKLRAANIDGVDIREVYDFGTSFKKAEIGWGDDYVISGGSEVTVYVADWVSGNTLGLHSRGCGDASYDSLYTIGKKLDKMAAAGELTGDALTDSIRAVEEYLIDEMALETCFEGYRFGDLMRIATHRGKDIGGAFENDFLAKRVATRETASMDDDVDYYQTMDNALYTKLLGNGKDLNKAWFLVLPDEK